MSIIKVLNLLPISLNWLSSIFLLAIRVYLARVFLWAGYLKATDWTTTLYTFKNDFKTYFLPPEVAAYLGTGLELVFPFLLLIGLGGRLSALVLFIFNLVSVVMVVSPEEYTSCICKDHILWGTLILILLFFGPGKISLDYLLHKKINKDYQY